ncbi:MAG: response regulator transcription factor [Trueperaceae bacterium]|nr:response regulator transcription factor [Trueperaceae bacterium]MCW5819273.1 response regulator transcription factor [Trueperaceae bacterium]
MRLLVIEDDPRIGAPLVEALEEGGHRVAWVQDGPGGLAEARAGEFDALILDVMLPGLDGFDVARTLRSEGVASPILFLSARGELTDRVTGLDLGGDAYLVKPFALAELKATLRALVRRGNELAPERIGFGSGRGELLAGERRVLWDGHEVALTGREYDVLEALLRAPERWFTRQELLDRVWGPDFFGEPRVVDVYVRYLRQKLANSVIESMRGRGYRAS